MYKVVSPECFTSTYLLLLEHKNSSTFFFFFLPFYFPVCVPDGYVTFVQSSIPTFQLFFSLPLLSSFPFLPLPLFLSLSFFSFQSPLSPYRSSIQTDLLLYICLTTKGTFYYAYVFCLNFSRALVEL